MTKNINSVLKQFQIFVPETNDIVSYQDIESGTEEERNIWK